MRVGVAKPLVAGFLAVAFVVLFGGAQDEQRWPWKYKSYGDPTKPAVVIVPGLDGCTSFFEDVVPELTVNFHVVMFYLPLAPKDGVARGVYSFQSLAGELRSVVDELDLPSVVLVGESFGGVVAQEFTLSNPDRVSKLVLLSSLCHTELTPEVAFKAKYLIPVVTVLGDLIPDLAQKMFAYLHLSDVVEVHEPTWVKDLFLRSASWAHHRSVMERIKLVIALDQCERVKAIQQPTLLSFGTDDNFTSAGSVELQASLPHTQLLPLPGGHLPHITSPKPFAQAVARFAAGELP